MLHQQNSLAAILRSEPVQRQVQRNHES